MLIKRPTPNQLLYKRTQKLKIISTRERISQNNYLSFAEAINNAPQLHRKEYNLFCKFLREEFKKSHKSTLEKYLPDALKYFNTHQGSKNEVNRLDANISGLSATDRQFALAAKLSKKKINFQELIRWAKDKIQIDLNQFKSQVQIYRYAFGLEKDTYRKCLHCDKEIIFYNFKYQSVYCSIHCQNTFNSVIKKFNGVHMNFNEYSKISRDLTENHSKKFKSLRSNKDHIDHKFSIAEGFKFGIHPAIISSSYNLHIIPSYVNVGKSTESIISVTELIDSYIKNHNQIITTEVVESLNNLAVINRLY